MTLEDLIAKATTKPKGELPPTIVMTMPSMKDVTITIGGVELKGGFSEPIAPLPPILAKSVTIEVVPPLVDKEDNK